MTYDDCPAGGAPAREPGGPGFEAAVTVADDDRALSIFAAADDAGDAPALRVGGRTFGFAELAGLVRARLDALDAEPHAAGARPVVGSNTLETVVTLYALFERREPALMLHPRLTDVERSALLGRARDAGPLPHPGAIAVMFTSGTTGTPRAAVLTRAAMLASARASEPNLGWQPDDCWLLCMPVAHVGGLSILTRCLSARRCVALSSGFDAPGFPALVERERVTLASLVPTMLARVLEAHPGWRAPATLRAILLGGAAASPRLLREARRRALPVLTSYGLTETSAQVCATRYEARFACEGLGAGEPLPGVRLRVADGRIQVAGPTLMAGYWGEPALAPDAWFDTGDVGEIDAAGRLHVHARRADLIVTGGENVYPVEVEQALELAPGIAGAAVFGVSDEIWGQTVAAALVADGAAPPDAQLAAWIAERLASHKRPRAIVYLPALPQTPGAKLDRAALPALAARLRPLRG